MKMIYFYLQYLFRKTFLNLFEIKKNIFTVYICNLLYFISKFTGGMTWQKLANINYAETVFGKFYIKPHSLEIITISPDFERTDIDYLLKEIKDSNSKYKNFYFFDIGANFGLYSIIVGNKLNDKVKIFGFEPFQESYELYKKNLKTNNIKNFKIFDFGLYNSSQKLKLKLDNVNPGGNRISDEDENSMEIIVKEFDKLDIDIDFKDSIAFIKMDIEGSETFALQGLKKTFDKFDEILILVEDLLINPEKELKKQNFKFETKISPYNSFWRKKNKK
jgi:FkbM family methyltransferase